jgi:filamentous hemagglutinin family protein
MMFAVVTGACANPRGGSVAYGTVGIDQSDPNVTRVIQSSDRAIVNWQGFSNQAHESIHFQQPGASSAILNRVTGGDPSRIEGAMSSNGQVYLVNPNGITFGSGARVNVGGLVASTLAISDQNFIRGHHRFEQDPTKPMAAVVNKGQIRAAHGGSVTLLAPVVDNQGTIVAAAGTVNLAAGTKAVVNPDGRGLVNLEYDGPVDGAVRMAKGDTSETLSKIVNTSNAQSAASMTVDGDTVMLQGVGGVAINSGTISTPGAAGQRAGTVRIDSVRGTVIEPTSRILANGEGARSNGGEVRVLSRGATRFTKDARIEAKGGTSGDGGFVEVSGTASVSPRGSVDTSALDGQTGTYLIDPKVLTILNSNGFPDSFLSDGAGTVRRNADNSIVPANEDATLSVQQIAEQSINNNIVLLAENIFLAFTEPLLLAPGRSLTIQATNGNIVGSPEALGGTSTPIGRTQSILTRGDITMTASGRIDLGEFYIRSDGPAATISLTAMGGSVTVGMLVAAPGGTPQAAGGRINITAAGDIKSGVVGSVQGVPAGLPLADKLGAQYTPNARADQVTLTATGGIFGKDAASSFTTAANHLTATAATRINVQDVGTGDLALGNLTAPTISVIANGALSSTAGTALKGSSITLDSLKSIGNDANPVRVDLPASGTLDLRPGTDTSPTFAAVIAGNVPSPSFTVPNTRGGVKINGITVAPNPNLTFFANSRTFATFTDMAEASNPGSTDSRDQYYVYVGYRGGAYTNFGTGAFVKGYAALTAADFDTDPTSAFEVLYGLLNGRIFGNTSPSDVTVLASLGGSTKNGAEVGFPPPAGSGTIGVGVGGGAGGGTGGTGATGGVGGSAGGSGSTAGGASSSSSGVQSTQFVQGGEGKKGDASQRPPASRDDAPGQVNALVASAADEAEPVDENTLNLDDEESSSKKNRKK